MAEEKRCDECDCWDRPGKPDENVGIPKLPDGFGLCRLNPPAPIPLELQPTVRPGVLRSVNVATWPLTRWDGWCRQFKKKEGNSKTL